MLGEVSVTIQSSGCLTQDSINAAQVFAIAVAASSYLIISELSLASILPTVKLKTTTIEIAKNNLFNDLVIMFFMTNLLNKIFPFRLNKVTKRI